MKNYPPVSLTVIGEFGQFDGELLLEVEHLAIQGVCLQVQVGLVQDLPSRTLVHTATLWDRGVSHSAGHYSTRRESLGPGLDVSHSAGHSYTPRLCGTGTGCQSLGGILSYTPRVCETGTGCQSLGVTLVRATGAYDS